MMSAQNRCWRVSLSLVLTMIATSQAFAQGTMVRPKPESSTTDSSGHLKKDDSAVTHEGTVRGVVVLTDGSAPQDLVSIYLDCGGVRTMVGVADSKGAFTFNSEILTEAAKPVGCAVLAVREGYQSDAKGLTGRSPKSEQKLGKFVLHPLASNPNGIVSTTGEQAGKAAKKNYEKARDQAAKGDLSGAIVSLQKATSDDPDYSSAWLSLGMLQQSRGDRAGAQKSFLASVRADHNFALPLIQIAALEIAKVDWRAALDHSQRAIDLNPQAFPDAYALNAMANLNLQNSDAAEKRAREGLMLDVQHQYPELEYSLGSVLLSRNDLEKAAVYIRLYLNQAPNGPNAAVARDELAQIQAATGKAREPAIPPQEQRDQQSTATPLQNTLQPPNLAAPTAGQLQERNAPLLARTSNHTCLESISRVQIDTRGKTHDPEQFLVEVAVSEDTEIYGSVDGKRFSNGRLADMLGSTFSTTGLFSSMARGLIAGNQTNIVFAGEETLNGESVYRYTFHVLSSAAGWSLRSGKESGQAKEEGWFLVDHSNLVLRRVAVHAVEIPRSLKLKSVDAVIDYEPETIADRRVLLPSAAQVRVQEAAGTTRVSRMFFHHCRAFAAESTLSFDAGTHSEEGGQTFGKRLDLPPDLEIMVSLRSPITSATTSANDTLSASVAEPVFSKGQEIIARGAVVEGHVLPLRGENGVVIELDRVQTRNGWAPFYARMVSFPSAPQAGVKSIVPSLSGAKFGDSTVLSEPEIPGVTRVTFASGSAGLAAGTRMIWRTELAEPTTESRPPQLKTSVGMN